MNKHNDVALPPPTLLALRNWLQASGDARSVVQVVDLAVRAWLATATRSAPNTAIAATRGYQWKSLFLPEGTLVRLRYRDDYATAMVQGDAIVYQGRRYSPRQLVIRVMGHARNAWLELWLRSPGDARWHLADTRRRILRRDTPSTAARAQALAQLHALTRAPEQAQETGPSQAQGTTPGLGQAQTAPPPVRQAMPRAAQQASPPQAQYRALLRAIQTRRRAAYLRRDDCVRDDQPDLSQRLPAGRGYGPGGAGRAGPRDRRFSNGLAPGRPAVPGTDEKNAAQHLR